jgi:hypothetical protein
MMRFNVKIILGFLLIIDSCGLKEMHEGVVSEYNQRVIDSKKMIEEIKFEGVVISTSNSTYKTITIGLSEFHDSIPLELLSFPKKYDFFGLSCDSVRFNISDSFFYNINIGDSVLKYKGSSSISKINGVGYEIW